MMTLQEFEVILKGADPNTAHYFGTGTGNYTVWAEYEEEPDSADDTQEVLYTHIQVDHYTAKEYSPMKDAISAALKAHSIPYRYTCFAEKDDQTGAQWIHHMWDCAVM